MTQNEIEEVVRGLSHAQKRRLLDIHALEQRGVSWASAHGSISVRTARATTAALLERQLIWSDGGNACLTPLGLAIRNHLSQTKEAGRG